MANIRQSMSRDDVLALLRETYAKLDALLERLDETEMAEARIHGDWTVKDMLAHLSSWERLEIGWMEAVLRGERPLLYAPGFEWDESDWRKRVEVINRFNAHVLEETKERTLDDVLTEFRTTQQRMLELAGQLPEHALSDPQVFFWLAVEIPRDPWTPIPVGSYEHYGQHIRWLRGWVKREKEGS